MGLGKTVQVIAMLAALLEKKGSGLDKVELVRRRKAIQKRLDENLKLQQEAMRQGTVAKTYVPTEGIDLPAWAPILIAVPPSVMENWMNELNTWGHFGAVKFAGPSRDLALERIREGLDEIMVCGSSLFKGSEDDLRQVKSIPWKLLIVDEYHQYKNFKTKSYEGLKGLKETCGAQLVGLTGTLMQNNHEELWSLVDLIHPGFLGTLEDFKADTSVPIKLGRTKTADEDTIETSNQIREWLSESLKIFYLQRLKSIELKNELPEKDERVLFCELSPLQKRLYKHLLSLPDFQLLLYANAPCECGVNQAIFQNFKLMRTEAEKIAFQRDHRGEIIPRKSCCYERPLNPNRFEAGEEFYDPRAVLWRWQHEALVNGDADEECDTCPFCCSFPVLDKLYKLSSHVSLLQVQKNPDTLQEGTKAWREARKALDFAKVAFPFDCLDELPGGSYFREDGIMNNHANLSGKMKVLAELLHEFDKRDDRILLFSFSTQTLDLIQNFVMAQGYSYLRLDGTTPTKARQGLVDRFQRDKSIFLFLISTKAGGLGLNLTEANIVIVFDVDFNPSNDEQSQDRAYRIGQKRDVLVIRLVSRGTVEELKYIRQIYKVQLKKDTIGSLQGGGEKNHEAARLFRAVAGDKERKGELFGMENLLKFKDGSFMEDLWKSTRTSRDKTLKGLERFSLQAKTDLADQLDTLPEDAVNHDGGDLLNAQFRQAASNYHKVQQAEGSTVVDLLNRDNAMSHEDFLRSDRGDAARKPGDEGFDEEMGGASQAAFHCLANAPGPDDEFD
jgi:SNF2 family DNA or RNA helicase